MNNKQQKLESKISYISPQSTKQTKTAVKLNNYTFKMSLLIRAITFTIFPVRGKVVVARKKVNNVQLKKRRPIRLMNVRGQLRNLVRCISETVFVNATV